MIAPEASRNGSGVSSTAGSNTIATVIATRYAPAASSQPFGVPSRAASRRPNHTPATASTTDTSTATRYQPVRAPIVSASPTAGGFGGYFTNGTRYTAPKAAAASGIESACGAMLLVRTATTQNSA